jgi:SEC-C motif
MAAIGRNDPCTCGSGKKYKRCCALKAEKTPLGSKIGLSLVGLLLLVGAVYFAFSLDGPGDGRLTPHRVWSQEHQHWH